MKPWSYGLARIAIIGIAAFGTLCAGGFLLFIPDVRHAIFSAMNTDVAVRPVATPLFSPPAQSPNVLAAQLLPEPSSVRRNGNIEFNTTPPDFPAVAVTPNESAANVSPAASQQKPFISVLISQILLADGQSPRHEFVELYNPNAHSIDVTGWELRKKTSGNSDSVLASSKKFSGMILGRGYLLVSHPEYGQEINADAVWSSDGYGISDNNTVYLVDADGRMVDRVGWGEAMDYESASAHNPGRGVAIARWSQTDTNMNQYDFSCVAPHPRNTKSATEFVRLEEIPCASGEFGPSRDSVTPSPNPSPAASAPPRASPSSSVAPSPLPSPSPVAVMQKILITEVQIIGPTGTTTDDFVELYNPNDRAVNLNDYQLVKRTQSDTEYVLKSWTTDMLLAPHAFYIWANSNYAALASRADTITSGTLASNNAIAVRAYAGGQVFDSAGWGAYAGAWCETQCIATNPGAGQSLSRKRAGAEFVDTGLTSADFEISTRPGPGQ